MVKEVFEAIGYPEEQAEVSAEVLVASDLKGITTHGVQRLKYYYDRVISKRHLTDTKMQIIKDKVGEKSKICVDGNAHKVCGGHHACAFYLAGNYLQNSVQQAGCDFVLSNNKRYSDKPLSPKNRGVFLFGY